MSDSNSSPQKYSDVPDANETKNKHLELNAKSKFNPEDFDCEHWCTVSDGYAYHLKNLTRYGVSKDIYQYHEGMSLAKCLRQKGYDVETDDSTHTLPGYHAVVALKVTFPK